MANNEFGHPIQWHLLTKRPTVFGLVHISILLPLVCYPFLNYGGVLLILWLVIDLLLVYTNYTLKAFISRIRLWAGGPKRSSVSIRSYQNIKRGQ